MYAFIILSLFFFLFLSRLLLLTSIARASQLREKNHHHFSQQPGVKITRNTTLKTASRDFKKSALALKRHTNETVPFENLLDNKDDGAKDAVVHIVADILIYYYVCRVCKRVVKCAEKPQKRQPRLEKKKKEKKKKIEGAATSEKNE